MQTDEQGFAGAVLPAAPPSTEHVVHLEAGGATRPGAKRRPWRRRANQDAILVDTERGLYLLADGMGGQPRGRAAARLVVDELPVLLRGIEQRPARNRRAMLEALAHATHRLSERVHAADPRMGATLALAHVRGTRLFTVHLGDSRVYRLRAGSLSLLTRDHSVAQVMIDAGAIDELTAALHPARHHLTRFVGMASAAPDARSFRLLPRDRLLLCSDGVHGVLPAPCLERIVCDHRCPAATAEAILDTVKARGGRDDASCIVIDPIPPTG